MTITEFSIRFDQPVYFPGQMITGQVIVSLDKPKDIRGVELKVKGRTKFKWTASESYTDSEGKSQTRTITHEGKEAYLKNEIKLIGKVELTIGVHTYPFAVMLPPNSPSTFSGKYGGIAYYGKAKVDIPLAVDKTTSCKQEKSKTFCCFCCASGPLTMVVYVPKTGFVKTEPIPITIEVDNASNVKVDSVKANLSRKIHWKAQGDSKEEKDKIKKLSFGDVPENSSKTWSENLALDCGPFPNIKNCNIITIDYKLEVEANPSGAHTDLEVEIPVTIGDIPFYDGENGAAPIPGQLSVATGYPQVNPAPGGFMAPDAGIGYPNGAGMQNPNVGFNPVAPAPYPSGPATPYPASGGVNPSPYPAAPGANPQGPYPPAPGEHPQGSYPSVPGGNPQGPYPPAQSPYTPPAAPYPPSPYASANGGAAPPYQNGPAGYPAVGGYVPPPSDPSGGNAVVYPPGEGAPNSTFYDPNVAPANNPGLFNGSSVAMPTSSFLGGDQGVAAKEANVSTPPLPSAPSAPSN